MQNEKFEWDDQKAADNVAAHGIDFDVASKVFEDPFGIELLDDRFDYAEERWIRIGALDGAVLCIVYTERPERRRIISARRATRVEQDEYFRQITSW